MSKSTPSFSTSAGPSVSKSMKTRRTGPLSVTASTRKVLRFMSRTRVRTGHPAPRLRPDSASSGETPTKLSSPSRCTLRPTNSRKCCSAWLRTRLGIGVDRIWRRTAVNDTFARQRIDVSPTLRTRRRHPLPPASGTVKPTTATSAPVAGKNRWAMEATGARPFGRKTSTTTGAFWRWTSGMPSCGSPGRVSMGPPDTPTETCAPPAPGSNLRSKRRPEAGSGTPRRSPRSSQPPLMLPATRGRRGPTRRRTVVDHRLRGPHG